jgi:hypothetical protein
METNEKSSLLNKKKLSDTAALLALIMGIAGFALGLKSPMSQYDRLLLLYFGSGVPFLLLELGNFKFWSAFRSRGTGRFVAVITGLAMLVMLVLRILKDTQLFSEIGDGVSFAMLGVTAVYFVYFGINFRSTREHKPGLSDLGLLIVLPVGFAAFSVFKLYTQKAEVSSAGKSDFTLSPAQLFAEFAKDEKAANSKYISKTIRFSGSVNEIISDSVTQFKLNAWKEGYSINCNFDASLKDSVSAVKQGDSVLLQCSCGGLTKPDEEMQLLSETALQMSRCSLINLFIHKPELGTDIEVPNKKTKPEKE